MYLRSKTAQHDTCIFPTETHTHTHTYTHIHVHMHRQRITVFKKESCHEVTNSANCTADPHIKRFTVSTHAHELVLAEGPPSKNLKGKVLQRNSALKKGVVFQ